MRAQTGKRFPSGASEEDEAQSRLPQSCVYNVSGVIAKCTSEAQPVGGQREIYMQEVRGARSQGLRHQTTSQVDRGRKALRCGVLELRYFSTGSRQKRRVSLRGLLSHPRASTSRSILTASQKVTQNEGNEVYAVPTTALPYLQQATGKAIHESEPSHPHPEAARRLSLSGVFVPTLFCVQEDKETSAKRKVFGGLDAHMEVRTMQGVMYLNSARGFVPTAHAARRGVCALIVMCVTINQAFVRPRMIGPKTRMISSWLWAKHLAKTGW